MQGSTWALNWGVTLVGADAKSQLGMGSGVGRAIGVTGSRVRTVVGAEAGL